MALLVPTTIVVVVVVAFVVVVTVELLFVKLFPSPSLSLASTKAGTIPDDVSNGYFNFRQKCNYLFYDNCHF